MNRGRVLNRRRSEQPRGTGIQIMSTPEMQTLFNCNCSFNGSGRNLNQVRCISRGGTSWYGVQRKCEPLCGNPMSREPCVFVATRPSASGDTNSFSFTMEKGT